MLLNAHKVIKKTQDNINNIKIKYIIIKSFGSFKNASFIVLYPVKKDKNLNVMIDNEIDMIKNKISIVLYIYVRMIEICSLSKTIIYNVLTEHIDKI